MNNLDLKPESPTRHEEITGETHATHGTNGATPQKRGGIVNTLYPPGPRPGAGPRMKNHCRKFWWCDLLVTVALILIIVLPIVFVAIPKKAQHDINASTLEVTSQEVSSPQPGSIHLKLGAVAESSSNFHPTIEAFKAGFALPGKEDKPFLYIDVPEVKAEAQTNISVDQDTPIANMDTFKEYNKVVMGNETFDVYMVGTTKVRQAGLKPISVDYNKKVTQKGLNKLQGLSISDIKILSGDEVIEGQYNMIGRVLIPNPSVMTLNLGNVTMKLSVDGTSIGTSLLPDMVLRPGDNNCSMQSIVNQLEVYQMIKKNYTDAVLPIDIVGESAVGEGGKHLEYFEEAIKSNTISVKLDVGPALAAVGLNVTSS